MTNLGQAHARLLASIGRQVVRELGSVRASDFQRFAYAVGDLDPRYVGTAEGPARRQAPPIYLSAVMGWGPGPAEADLRSDGTDAAATAGLPLDGLRLMGAGQELTFHRPVHDGDRVSRTDSVESAELKEGRSGALIVVTIRREYRTSVGEPVLTCIESFIAR